MNEDRAFRWIEVLSVLVIIGTVIALSVPKSGEVKRAREAQQLLADVEVVRKAVYRFYSDSAYFPAQVAGSQVSAVNPDTGGLIDDFLILEDEFVINVCNAPSPAATSSLAIGKAISEMVFKR